ncbi:hypothetical protein K474DRAFT_1588997 [Panus rudis PR-1116 ss-1]|nr:hypothetical protein K474DRAFT_1588997 [Panus rudis PR-1116 ss-1]
MSTLLQWCDLQPQGPSGLAAIRFPVPVRIHSMSIYPKGMQPFAADESIVSRTEPEAFFLDVYFNSHPVVAADAKEKPKPTNALLHSLVPYAGDQLSFAVNMSKEFATRLMIVKGTYDVVSMAIYGEVVSENVSLPTIYTPRPSSLPEPIPIVKPLDPAMSRDPTQLARQLLSLIPDAPPLPLVIRLMFCLKPSNEDWDLEEFPYLHPNLDDSMDDFDLEKACELTSRPVSDDTELETIQNFANQVANVTDEKDEDQAIYIACLLSNSASQTPELSRLLIQSMDVSAMFDPYSIDSDTLSYLLDASSNADIARYLNNDLFLETLNTVAKDANAGPRLQSMARRLSSRIEGWAILEDALSNTQGDFPRAVDCLADMCSQEGSFGVWLESMITHQDIAAKLGENPTIPIPSQHPPVLLGRSNASVPHDEFIAFLRAFIGVACVLAVYAWADSLPDQRCRERILGILRLWQGIEGYREIVNHLLLLRQMIFRLGCMLDNELPTKSGIDAEHIIVNLAENPRSFLSKDFVECVLSLKPPLSYITNEQHISLRRSAYIADDGLEGAIDELTREAEYPPTIKSLRGIRVSLAIVDQELNEDEEHYVLEAFWKDESRGALTCLVEVLKDISGQLQEYFSITQPPPTPPKVIAWLFHTCGDTMRLISRLLLNNPLPGPPIRSLAREIANVFFCTDAADVLYSQSSDTCRAAQETRQPCIDLIQLLADPRSSDVPNKPSALIVLRTLLEHGLQSGNKDPAQHLTETFYLIDYLIPNPRDATDADISMWVRGVLPKISKELWAFYRVLDIDNKAHFMRRLVSLDYGEVGIGDWLLQKELEELSQTLQSLRNDSLSENLRNFKLYQVGATFIVMDALTSGSGSDSEWITDCLNSGEDITQSFASCLWDVFHLHLVSPSILQVSRVLATLSTLDKELSHPLALIILQSLTLDVSMSTVGDGLMLAQSLLSLLPPEDIDFEGVAATLGAALANIASKDDISNEIAESIYSLLDWFTQTARTRMAHLPPLIGITTSTFNTLSDRIGSLLDETQVELWDATRAAITIDVAAAAPSYTTLPETVQLSIQDLESLLNKDPPPVPSTPPRKALNQDILSLVTVSPPTALIRSPAVTGLTKTYLNNDFRQLRQTPSARQNTSRLPSMHVDVGSLSSS